MHNVYGHEQALGRKGDTVMQGYDMCDVIWIDRMRHVAVENNLDIPVDYRMQVFRGNRKVKDTNGVLAPYFIAIMSLEEGERAVLSIAYPEGEVRTFTDLRPGHYRVGQLLDDTR